MTCYPVCSLEELSDSEARKFTVEDVEILLARGEDGAVFAFAQTCTHADKSLEKGRWNAALGQITCPFHRAVFDVKNGGAVLKPPACVPLPVYKTEVRGSVVYVDVV